MYILKKIKDYVQEQNEKVLENERRRYQATVQQNLNKCKEVFLAVLDGIDVADQYNVVDSKLSKIKIDLEMPQEGSLVLSIPKKDVLKTMRPADKHYLLKELQSRLEREKITSIAIFQQFQRDYNMNYNIIYQRCYQKQDRTELDNFINKKELEFKQLYYDLRMHCWDYTVLAVEDKGTPYIEVSLAYRVPVGWQ